MTKTFERFLRSFSDEDLEVFARERGAVSPPYWRALRTALRIELDRRGLRSDTLGSATGAGRRRGKTA